MSATTSRSMRSHARASITFASMRDLLASRADERRRRRRRRRRNWLLADELLPPSFGFDISHESVRAELECM